MSTRCNVIVKDRYNQLIFYRQSDGYPEGVADTLNLFLQWVKEGKIRNEASQAAGWLILIGHDEYAAEDLCGTIADHQSSAPKGRSFSSWKCGAYEPTTGIHGDIEYLYEIDLDAKTLKGWHHDGEEKGDPVEIPTLQAPTAVR